MKTEADRFKLYAVTDRSWLKEGETLASVLEEMLAAGVTMVQLREKKLDDDSFLKEACKIRELCRRYGVPLIINDRPDIAKKAGADGVHVGLSDMGIEKAREYLGGGFIIGGSAHNVGEAMAAQAAGADYIGCGAVFGSSTKTDASDLSIEELRAICSAVTIPAVAIGGIRLDNVHRLAGTGIAGVAVISGLFAAENKKEAVRNVLNQAADWGHHLRPL